MEDDCILVHHRRRTAHDDSTATKKYQCQHGGRARDPQGNQAKPARQARPSTNTDGGDSEAGITIRPKSRPTSPDGGRRRPSKHGTKQPRRAQSLPRRPQPTDATKTTNIMSTQVSKEPHPQATHVHSIHRRRPPFHQGKSIRRASRKDPLMQEATTTKA